MVDHVDDRCHHRHGKAEKDLAGYAPAPGQPVDEQGTEKNSQHHRYELPAELLRAKLQMAGDNGRGGGHVQEHAGEIQCQHASLEQERRALQDALIALEQHTRVEFLALVGGQ